jgi:hypothetical protein
MSSFLAGALVEPASDEEWHFLETCLREYKNEDRALASFSAALALGVNASPQALRLLETVVAPGQSPTPDNDTFQEVTQAIQWIKHRSSLAKAAAPAKSESDSEQIKHVFLRGGHCVHERERPGTSLGRSLSRSERCSRLQHRARTEVRGVENCRSVGLMGRVKGWLAWVVRLGGGWPGPFKLPLIA